MIVFNVFSIEIQVIVFNNDQLVKNRNSITTNITLKLLLSYEGVGVEKRKRESAKTFGFAKSRK